jgi:hypothetical protein
VSVEAIVSEMRAFRALRDRAGRRRNARHASEAGLANAAARGRYCSHGKGGQARPLVLAQGDTDFDANLVEQGFRFAVGARIWI